MVIFLIGGKHSAEHFKVDEVPNRVLIQTKENSYSIFQHNGNLEDGNYEFRFVRSQRGKLNGYFETETEPSSSWGGMYK